MSNCPKLTSQDIQIAIERFNSAYVLYKNNQSDVNKNNLLKTHTYLNSVIQCYTSTLDKNTVYNEQTYVDLVKKYNSVVQQRNNLDIKLQEVYNLQKSLPVENRLRMDSSVYSTILLSIFATSILFIVFVKL